MVAETLPSQATLVTLLAATLLAVAVALLLVVPTIAALAFDRAKERLGARESAHRIGRWFAVLAGSVAAFGIAIGLGLVAYFFPGGVHVMTGSSVLDVAVGFLAVGIMGLTTSALALAREIAPLALKLPDR